MDKKTIIAVIILLALGFLAFALTSSERFIAKEQQGETEKSEKSLQQLDGQPGGEALPPEFEKEELLEGPREEAASGEPEGTEEPMGTADFKYHQDQGAYYGKLAIEGYATAAEVSEGFCDQNCKTFTYLSFNILETENEAIFEYIGGQQGNSFVGKQSIGIGCVDGGAIWRYNDSDEFGMKIYKNSKKESEAILNSSENETVNIELERYLFTGGSEAPDCYSHFAEIGLAE